MTTQGPRMAMALSPDEEATLRRHPEHHLPDDDEPEGGAAWCVECFGWQTMSRVLATLDEARSSARQRTLDEVEAALEALRGPFMVHRAAIREAIAALRADVGETVDYAMLIKEYGVEPRQIWEQALSEPSFRAALDEGLKDVAEGRTKPWADVRACLISRLRSRRKTVGEETK